MSDSQTFTKCCAWLKANCWWVYGAWMLLLTLAMVFLWNSSGEKDLDALSVSLTILEIFLVIFAVSGFWLVRANARETARDEARDEALREARRVAEPVARRAAIDWLMNKVDGGPADASDSLQEMMDSLDGDEDTGND